MDNIISAVWKNVAEVRRGLEKEAKQQKKDLQTAVKIEGYRLRKLMAEQIRKAAPGGHSFRTLSEIARRTGARNVRGEKDLRQFGQSGFLSRARNARQALRRLALGVRYQVRQTPDFQMHIGFTGPRVSKSFKRLAVKHQQGFTSEVTEEMRRMFARRGAALKGKWKRGKGRSGGWEHVQDPAAKYFFLKKSTTRLKTPARPIIAPFWQKYEGEARRNIRENFRRKRLGERI
jgi:hypothetical protein